MPMASSSDAAQYDQVTRASSELLHNPKEQLSCKASGMAPACHCAQSAGAKTQRVQVLWTKGCCTLLRSCVLGITLYDKQMSPADMQVCVAMGLTCYAAFSQLLQQQQANLP